MILICDMNLKFLDGQNNQLIFILQDITRQETHPFPYSKVRKITTLQPPPQQLHSFPEKRISPQSNADLRYHIER